MILTYVVYRQNKDNKFIKILFIAAFIHTLICAVLGLYELYYTLPDFGEKLIFGVTQAQICFEVEIEVVLLIYFSDKKIDKGIVTHYFKMYLYLTLIMNLVINLFLIIVLKYNFTLILTNLVLWISSSAILVNYYNPLLLYILSNTE